MKQITTLLVSLLLPLLMGCNIHNDNPYESINQHLNTAQYGIYDGYWSINGVKSDTTSLYAGVPINIGSLPHRPLLSLQLKGDSLQNATTSIRAGGFSLHYYSNGISSTSYYFMAEPQTDYAQIQLNGINHILKSSFSKPSIVIYNEDTQTIVVSLVLLSMELQKTIQTEEGEYKEIVTPLIQESIKLVYTGKKRK